MHVFRVCRKRFIDVLHMAELAIVAAAHAADALDDIVDAGRDIMGLEEDRISLLQQQVEELSARVGAAEAREQALLLRVDALASSTTSPKKVPKARSCKEVRRGSVAVAVDVTDSRAGRGISGFMKENTFRNADGKIEWSASAFYSKFANGHLAEALSTDDRRDVLMGCNFAAAAYYGHDSSEFKTNEAQVVALDKDKPLGATEARRVHIELAEEVEASTVVHSCQILHPGTDTECWLFAYHPYDSSILRIVVSYRGTASLRDAYTDIGKVHKIGGVKSLAPILGNLKPDEAALVCKDILVHKGFLGQYDNTRQAINAEVEKAINLAGCGADYEMWVCGHSMGGGIAALATFGLIVGGVAVPGRTRLITIGNAPAGNSHFARVLEKLLGFDRSPQSTPVHRPIRSLSVESPTASFTCSRRSASPMLSRRAAPPAHSHDIAFASPVAVWLRIVFDNDPIPTLGVAWARGGDPTTSCFDLLMQICGNHDGSFAFFEHGGALIWLSPRRGRFRHHHKCTPRVQFLYRMYNCYGLCCGQFAHGVEVYVKYARGIQLGGVHTMVRPPSRPMGTEQPRSNQVAPEPLTMESPSAPPSAPVDNTVHEFGAAPSPKREGALELSEL